MKALLCAVLLGLFATHSLAHEAPRHRKAIALPDIPGYVTLKCDFHIHTVFSDGMVWPTVRAEEAWREGLDAIAITDHIEHLPHKADMIINHNRAHQLAKGRGDELQLMVIAGSEITRDMPPGHLNAIFLTNAALLETPLWRDAIDAAHQQGAFIFWNHPGWDRQLSNGVGRWYPEHTELLQAGKLHGIEVVNGRHYYPEAHRWALEKNLTMFSNSDIHQPMHMDYQLHAGDHRPVTLVLARDRSKAALKEALFARRTVLYAANRLIGREEFLRPLFERSLTYDRATVELSARRAVLVQISNASDVAYQLELVAAPAGSSAPRRLTLPGQRTALLELRAAPDAPGTGGALTYRVTNLLVAPDEPLVVTLPLTITLPPP